MNTIQIIPSVADQFADRRRSIENSLREIFNMDAKLVNINDIDDNILSAGDTYKNFDELILDQSGKNQPTNEQFDKPQQSVDTSLARDGNPEDSPDALCADTVNREPSTVRKIYYDIFRKEYLVKNADGIWMPQTESQARRLLKSFGITGRKSPGAELSPLDYEIMRINNEDSVVYVGSIAGMREGFYNDGQKILVTDSPNLIIPKNGEWSTLQATTNIRKKFFCMDG